MLGSLIPTQEAEAGGFLISRSAWFTEGQPGLQRKTVLWGQERKKTVVNE